MSLGYEMLDDAGKRTIRRCTVTSFAIVAASIVSQLALLLYLINTRRIEWVLVILWSGGTIAASRFAKRCHQVC